MLLYTVYLCGLCVSIDIQHYIVCMSMTRIFQGAMLAWTWSSYIYTSQNTGRGWFFCFLNSHRNIPCFFLGCGVSFIFFFWMTASPRTNSKKRLQNVEMIWPKSPFGSRSHWGEDLMEDMLSLDSLGNLYQEDRQERIGGFRGWTSHASQRHVLRVFCQVRKKALAGIESLVEQVGAVSHDRVEEIFLKKAPKTPNKNLNACCLIKIKCVVKLLSCRAEYLKMTIWNAERNSRSGNLVVNVQQVDSAKAMLMKRQKEVEKASPIVVCCSIMSTDIDLPSLVAYLLLLQKWFWILLAKLEKKNATCSFLQAMAEKAGHCHL